MLQRISLVALVVIAGYWSVAQAQRPIVDAIANKVIQKYQQSSCEQLLQKKNEPKTAKEQEAVERLRNNPQIRTEFLNKVAPTVANKLFECGLIP